MKNLKTISTILTMVFLALSIISCKEKKNEQDNLDGHHSEVSTDEHEMDHDITNETKMSLSDNEVMNHDGNNTSGLIADYLDLKNGLVTDSKEKAAQAGDKLAKNFSNFDISMYSIDQQKELNDIIETAKENAEHIAKNDINHQREHFEGISKDMIDFLAITGTDQTLYQQFCPMYNNNKGGMWLSESNEIKNPYFGSKMLTCGSTQKQIN